MQIKEWIVVEGKCDTAAIERAVQAKTIETNGSALDEATLRLIEKAHAQDGVIVFTDPDYPGRRIRALIEERIPTVKHAFLMKRDAIPEHKGSVGIEHASNEAIQEALSAVYSLQEDGAEETVSRAYLVRRGFIGAPQSKQLRHRLGEALQIGETNGKTLLKRLNLFHITEEEIEEWFKMIEEK